MYKTVDILGTEYTIETLDVQDSLMKEENLSGYIDFIKKEIKILDISKEENKKIVSHEVIHCLLYESGVENGLQFHTEECVNFFAMQLPKLNKILKEIDMEE